LVRLLLPLLLLLLLLLPLLLQAFKLQGLLTGQQEELLRILACQHDTRLLKAYETVSGCCCPRRFVLCYCWLSMTRGCSRHTKQ
jgi:hypothetical protein